MGPWVILLAVASTGCQLVFSLGEPPDAAPYPCKVGHDEDDDGVSDTCDNCVGVANPLQEDVIEDGSPGGTADGIGDACDPNPMASDAVALTITFAGDEENNQWLADSPQIGWRFDGESAVFEGVGTGEQAAVRTLRIQPPRPFVIELGVSVNSPFDFGYIGVRSDITPGLPPTDPRHFGVECGVLHSLRQADQVPVASSAAGHRNVQLPGTEGGLLRELPAKATRYRILMRYDVPADQLGDRFEDLRCIVQGDLAEPGIQTQINFVTPLPPGTELALAALTATAQIDYLVIYRPL